MRKTGLLRAGEPAGLGAGAPRDRPGTAKLAAVVAPLWLGKALPRLQWPRGELTSWI